MRATLFCCSKCTQLQYILWAPLWRLSAHCFTALVVNVFYNSLFSTLWSNACQCSPPTLFVVKITTLNYACSQRLLQFVIVLCLMKKHSPLHYTCSQPVVQCTFVIPAIALRLEKTYCTIHLCKCAPLHYAYGERLLHVVIRLFIMRAIALLLQSTYFIVHYYKPLYVIKCAPQHNTFRQAFVQSAIFLLILIKWTVLHCIIIIIIIIIIIVVVVILHAQSCTL